MSQSQIEFTVDVRPVKAGMDQANASIDSYEKKAVVAGQRVQDSLTKTSDVTVRLNEKNRQSFESLTTAMMRQTDQFTAHQNAFQRLLGDAERLGHGIGRVGIASAHAVEGVLALGGAFAGARALMKETTKEVGLLEVAAGKLRNVGRAVETAWAGIRHGAGAAIDVAGTLAAVAAVERIAEVTYQRGKQLEQQSIQAAKSGLSYNEVATLGFGASRAGVSANFFDSAAKTAGGAAQLADQFKRIGEIADPVERTRKAFEVFGQDAEKYLPYIDERLAENIQRFTEFGLVIDKVDRENIGQFKRDIDSLKGSFVGLGDVISAWATGVGNSFAKAFGSVYSTLREGSRQGAALLGLAVTAGAGLTTPNIAFSTTPFDAAGALRQTAAGTGATGLAQATFLQSVQGLRGPGSAAFLKGAAESEGAVSSRVQDLQKRLFISDVTSPQYGQLQPAAAFPGGYSAQALALQQYISGQNRLKQFADEKKAAEDQKKAQAELESAQKSVASSLQQAQLSELTGSNKLRAERDIAIAQYGKTKDLIGQINQEFDIRFREEGKRLIDQSHADLVARAGATAQEQNALLAARSLGQATAIVGAGRLGQQFAAKGGEQDLLNAESAKSFQLKILEATAADELGQKLRIEEQKLAIEETFVGKRKELEFAGLRSTYDKDLSELDIQLRTKFIRESDYNLQRSALDRNYLQDQRNLEQRAASDIAEVRLTTAIDSNKAIAADNKRLQDQQQAQVDAIKTKIEPLVKTLFDHPTRFPAELGTTLRDAALHPITEGIANVTAGFLQPILHGGNRTLSITAERPLPVYVVASGDGLLHDSLVRGQKGLLGLTKFGGVPVYQMSGSGNNTVGQYDPEKNRIELFPRTAHNSYGPDEYTYGVARTLLHESAHALLQKEDIGALNKLLPNDYATETMRELIKSKDYNKDTASLELIPRLLVNEGPYNGDTNKAFESFLTGLKKQNPGLASTFEQMHYAIGSATRDASTAEDLLTNRTGVPLKDSLLSAANPASAIGPGGTAAFSPSPIGFGGTFGSDIATPSFGGAPTFSGGTATGGRGGGILGGLQGLFHGGGGAGANLSGLGKIFGVGTADQPAGPNPDGGFIPSSGTSFASVAKSPAAGAAGLFLASQGLLGNNRGTGLGVVEGTAGGALIGEQYGGPIGAAIGAAAGFGIGLGELVAGVVAPWRRVQELVKSKYNINIPHAEAQKIVDIAGNSFGGNLQVAVESPTVRQLLGLYAAGTGQKFPASADQPHGAVLQEQGGRLFQQQTYQYGQGYAYSSNLPVAGGYSPQTLPNPSYGNSGQIMMQVNIDGKGSGDYMAGNIFTADYVQSRWAQAGGNSNGRVDNSILMSEPGLIQG